MISGNQIPTAATARVDREFAGWNRKHRLRQIAGRIRLAIISRIPVGFEDEAGFHLGVQPAWKADGIEWERAGLSSQQENF